MKKILFFILTISSLSVFGQFNQVGINSGLVLGKAILDSNFPDYIGKDNQTYAATHISIYADYRLNKYFTVSPEIAYTFKGSRLNYNYTRDRGTTHQVRIKFIEAPVLLKFFFSDGKAPAFFELGPSMAVALRSYEYYDRRVGEDEKSDRTTKISISNTPIINPDFFFNFGFGFIKNTKTVNWGLGFRYQFSFNKSTYIFQVNDVDNSVTRYAAKTGDAVLYLKLAFNLNRKTEKPK